MTAFAFRSRCAWMTVGMQISKEIMSDGARQHANPLKIRLLTVVSNIILFFLFAYVLRFPP